MVFSSVPVYLDPPNWQQQLQGGIGMADNSQQRPLQPPQTLGGVGGGGGSGGTSSIRPGSMAERARQAKIPQPEAALKCPRCESTNTKFCYFNNYSLTQPRHFCKTCRRYWTRGGALRNVPVGGGCRRNRRSKGSSRSKSPAVNKGSTSSSKSDDIITNMPPPQAQIPILPPISHLGGYNGDILLNYATACDGSGGGGSILSNGYAMEEWKMQQQHQQEQQGQHQQQQFFPFLINSGNLFQGEDQGLDDQPCGSNYIGQLRSKQLDSINGGILNNIDQMGSSGGGVKMEDNQGFISNNNNNNNLARNYLLGITGNYDQYMAGTTGSNSWIPGFASSSSTTSHL